jgi:hypothetical protein
MSVLAPTGVILSFVCPEENIQRKDFPTAAYFLGSEALDGGWRGRQRKSIPPNINYH